MSNSYTKKATAQWIVGFLDGYINAARGLGVDINRMDVARALMGLVVNERSTVPQEAITPGGCAPPVLASPAEAFAGPIEDDSEQACSPTDHCVKFECQEWRDGKPWRPELVLQASTGFWICPKCQASYGRDAKGTPPALTREK